MIEVNDEATGKSSPWRPLHDIVEGCGTILLGIGAITGFIVALNMLSTIPSDHVSFDKNYAPGATYHLLDRMNVAIIAVSLIMVIAFLFWRHHSINIQNQQAQIIALLKIQVHQYEQPTPIPLPKPTVSPAISQAPPPEPATPAPPKARVFMAQK